MSHKRALTITLFAMAAIAAIAVTFATLVTEVNLSNYFSIRGYKADISEDFTSPPDWVPGTTTEKLVYAENKGDGPIIVRISYEEKWEAEDGTILPNIAEYKDGKWMADGTDLSECVDQRFINPVEGAKIEFAVKNWLNAYTAGDNRTLTGKSDSNAAWQYDNGYYYYVDILEGGAKTPAYLGSVTFNKAVAAAKGMSGYDNALYTLTIKVETIQANRPAMTAAWGIDENTPEGAAAALYNKLAK